MSNITLLANALRFISVDAIQKANSGHPGMPLGMADIAAVLWLEYLKHNPCNPHWFNRDRFVLSNGHGCMLLYALLHLTGYDLSLDEIKKFRQLHAQTPGHPELGITPGVETTTGPLGQGLANAVGMAITEQHLAAVFNRPGFNLIDHYVYVFVGDGCLMEGISHEVCSLAGSLNLGKLIVFFDDNGISIDGEIKAWCCDNIPLRFKAYNWHVIVIDGHDPAAISEAIKVAQETTTKPSLICCKTVIGYGAPNKAGSHLVHGSALGKEEIAAMRQKLAWPYPEFVIPEEIYQAWNQVYSGTEKEEIWNKLFIKYHQQYPELAIELQRLIDQKLPHNWPEKSAQILDYVLKSHQNPMATRKASKLCLDYYAVSVPELFGGSADLTESNGTLWDQAVIFTPNSPIGRYLHYGVREFGMSAIMNGMSAHGGIIPYGGTFLVFSDYARNAIRMAALMRLKTIFVYTHDSIGLGEDGGTHQPIEHLSSLRLIPQISLWRPCDIVETAIAWQSAIEYNGPTCLALSRQNLPYQQRNDRQINNIKLGGYILFDAQEGNKLDAIVIATGSEVAIAIDAARELLKDNIYIRVVSMPSVNTFLAQDNFYREQVLPSHITARIAIEAGASNFWWQLVGSKGKVLGIDQFGLSAQAEDIYSLYKLTSRDLIKVIQTTI